MHQRAGRQEEIWQGAEDMRRMLHDQEEARDREEAHQDHPASRAPPGRLNVIIHGMPRDYRHRVAKKL